MKNVSRTLKNSRWVYDLHITVLVLPLNLLGSREDVRVVVA